MSNALASTPAIDALSGSASSVLALYLIYPLDTIKVRYQVQNSKDHHAYSGIFDAFKKILASEGLQGLYRGLGSSLINQATTGYIYFYFYSYIKTNYRRITKVEANKGLSTLAELAIGAVSGMLCQCFTLPLNVIATRQQTSSSKSQESIVDVIREIIEIDGILGLWKGFKPTMVLCINPAITYGVFERTKTMLLERKSKNTDITSAYLLPSEAFAAGALSKTLATVVTYPYITAKTRLMWRPSKEEVEKFGDDVIYKDTTDVLKKTFKIAGVAGLYKGMQMQIIKAVISQALVLMIKESLTRYIIRMFMLLNRKKLKAAA